MRFHLPFSPTEVGLKGTAGRQHKLPITRTPAWRLSGEGTFVLFARAKAGGDASYAGCIRFG